MAPGGSSRGHRCSLRRARYLPFLPAFLSGFAFLSLTTAVSFEQVDGAQASAAAGPPRPSAAGAPGLRQALARVGHAPRADEADRVPGARDRGRTVRPPRGARRRTHPSSTRGTLEDPPRAARAHAPLGRRGHPVGWRAAHRGDGRRGRAAHRPGGVRGGAARRDKHPCPPRRRGMPAHDAPASGGGRAPPRHPLSGRHAPSTAACRWRGSGELGGGLDARGEQCSNRGSPPRPG